MDCNGAKALSILLEHLLTLPEIKGAVNEEGVQKANELPFQLLCVTLGD